MNPRNYSRQSFESIRQAERQRFQELSAVRLEFGLGEDWLAHAVESGTDPAEARAQRDQLIADERRRAEGSEIVALAAGPLGGPPAAELVCRAWFARPDAAATMGVVEGQRVQFDGRPRDALARVAGITGQGADPWFVYQMAERSGVIITGPVGRIDLSMTGRPLTSSGLPAALRDALDTILTYDWRRSGSWWQAASTVIDSIDFRPRRFWIAQGSVQDAEIVPEAGEAPHSPDGGAAGWVYADLQVRQRKETLLLSRQRMINVGGVELGSWVSARLMLWHDGLDRAVADLLTNAAVRTNQGTFDAAHFASAVAALNTQKVGGVPLGSSRPILLAGEARRALMSAVPGPARASGDEAAVLSRVVYSASVDPDFLCLVHPEHAPCAIGGLGGRLDPQAAVGSFAGVRLQDGAMSERGAMVAQDRSDPALCVDGDGNAVGVVRMIA